MDDERTPRLGAHDRWQKATRSQYATRHNPFMYFRSITGHPAYCKPHVRPLSALTADLKHASTTRNLSYITPDLCRDGHDAPCANGGPGGSRRSTLVQEVGPQDPRLAGVPGDGMLVITGDESDGPREDSTACCGEGVGPNAGRPGIEGPGGGRVGALVISRFAEPSTLEHDAVQPLLAARPRWRTSSACRKLGMAPRERRSTVFGLDVYNACWFAGRLSRLTARLDARRLEHVTLSRFRARQGVSVLGPADLPDFLALDRPRPGGERVRRVPRAQHQPRAAAARPARSGAATTTAGWSRRATSAPTWCRSSAPPTTRGRSPSAR